jgi:hypothetical protein
MPTTRGPPLLARPESNFLPFQVHVSKEANHEAIFHQQRRGRFC